MGSVVNAMTMLLLACIDVPKTRYLDIANAAMKTTDWEGSNGVITEGADNSANGDGIGFKGENVHVTLMRGKCLTQVIIAVFIRGLHEAYQRSHNSAFQILIHSYLDVQVSGTRSWSTLRALTIA